MGSTGGIGSLMVFMIANHHKKHFIISDKKYGISDKSGFPLFRVLQRIRKGNPLA